WMLGVCSSELVVAVECYRRLGYRTDGVVAPGVVSVEHAVRLVPEPTVELDGHEVLRAHLESDGRQTPLTTNSFGGLHHQRSDPAAAGFRCDGNGQDAARVALEKVHHRRGNRFPTVLHKRQGSLV